MDYRSADVELRAGQVEAGGAADATRAHVIDDDGGRALLAAILAAEHEDRVDDAAADGRGSSRGVVTETETIRIEEIDRTKVDGVRLAGGIGRQETDGDATCGDRVDSGEVERQPDVKRRRGGIEGGAVRVEGRPAD